jgi:hypothetical protein
MALNDEIAARVMGELHALTNKIDEQNMQVISSAEVIKKAAELIKQNSDAAVLNAKETVNQAQLDSATRFERRMAGVVSAAERQKTFAWAAGSLVGLSMFMFGAGMALGSQNGMGWGFLTVLALGVGFIGGLVALQLLVAGGQLSTGSKSAKSDSASGGSDSAWTLADFLQAMKETKATDNHKVVQACQYVLVRKMGISEASEKERVPRAMVQKSILKLQNWKKK